MAVHLKGDRNYFQRGAFRQSALSDRSEPSLEQWHVVEREEEKVGSGTWSSRWLSF
ncbi:hypothetical protein AAG906_000619 [Vitis piasezkii]